MTSCRLRAVVQHNNIIPIHIIFTRYPNDLFCFYGKKRFINSETLNANILYFLHSSHGRVVFELGTNRTVYIVTCTRWCMVYIYIIRSDLVKVCVKVVSSSITILLDYVLLQYCVYDIMRV